MEPMAVKDYMACYLSQQGVNHDSIEAILCNVYAESGFKVGVEEYSGGGGFGLFQWTANADGVKARAYAQGGHTEEENIKYQCDLMLNNPGQWIAKSSFNFSFSDFLSNKPGLSVSSLTVAFTTCWERPLAIPNRYNLYDRYIQPISFCSDSNATATTDTQSQQFNIKNCFKETNQQGSNGQSGSGGGNNAGWDSTKPLAYYNQYKSSLYYSMTQRSLVTQGIASDCSAYVSYMASLGYADIPFGLYSTETLHAYLKAHGFNLKQDTAGTTIDTSLIKGGDVIILGLIGTSAGAAGHTQIAFSASQIYDCHYGTPALGVFEVATYNNYLNNTARYWSGVWHVYHYTRS